MLHRLYMHPIKITREVLSMNDPKKDENHVHHENMNHEQSPNDVENNLDQQQNVFSDVGRDEETASEITGFDNDILDRDDDIDVDNQVRSEERRVGKESRDM